MGNCAPVNEKMLKNTTPYSDFENIYKIREKTKGIVIFEDEESKEAKLKDDPETQLLTASKDGNYEIVLELLRKNVNVDVKNCDGDTPLILASYYNHVNIVEEIFKYYPNINAKNNNGMTAEKIASSKKHQQIVQMIFRNYQTTDSQFSEYNFNTSLMLAVGNGHVGVAKTLLENGANVESTNYKNETPLMVASFNGHTNVVSELLRCGANIKAKNIDRMTAYDFAVLKNHRNVATLLQNINKQDNTSIHKVESVPKKNLIEMTTCPVCMINERKIIFGCGHSVCFKCSNSLDKCLMCVTKITVRTQCYF
jgi:ankyrin repeat protein